MKKSRVSGFGTKMLDFYKHLKYIGALPPDVQALNIYQNPEIYGYLQQFFEKYFSDINERILVLGINPGRLGSGTTGISFTDPVVLADVCGIPNPLPHVRERSSEFIYACIEHMGGPQKFYKQFYISAVCPIGFTKRGVNYNYYDHPELWETVQPFIIKTLKQQISGGTSRKAVVILGTGKNLKFFTELNNKHHFFDHVLMLEHPRFIMQYKRKQISTYLKKYKDTLNKALKIKNV